MLSRSCRAWTGACHWGQSCYARTGLPTGNQEPWTYGPPTRGGWINCAHPRGRNLETCCLSHARKIDVAQARPWVSTLFLCLCEVQNYSVHMEETLYKIVHIIPHSQLNPTELGWRSSQSHPAGKSIGRTPPGKVSSQTRSSANRMEGEWVISKHVEKKQYKKRKKKRLQQTVGMEGK